MSAAPAQTRSWWAAPTAAEKPLLPSSTLNRLPLLGADDIAGNGTPRSRPRCAGAGREFKATVGSHLERRRIDRDRIDTGGSQLGAQRSGSTFQGLSHHRDSGVSGLPSSWCLRPASQNGVRQGGHDVPEADVRRRFQRVFPVFWEQYRQHAHHCLLRSMAVSRSCRWRKPPRMNGPPMTARCGLFFKLFFRAQTDETNPHEHWSTALVRVATVRREVQAKTGSWASPIGTR